MPNALAQAQQATEEVYHPTFILSPFYHFVYREHSQWTR